MRKCYLVGRNKKEVSWLDLTQAYTHTYTHTHTNTHIYTHTRTHIHIIIHSYTHRHGHTQIYTHRHTHIHRHTDTHRQTHTQINKHTDKHTHITNSIGSIQILRIILEHFTVNTQCSILMSLVLWLPHDNHLTTGQHKMLYANGQVCCSVACNAYHETFQLVGTLLPYGAFLSWT